MSQQYEFYWGSGSPFAWRAMLALELKNVPYESKLVQFSKGEHKTPEYLAMNPRGKVPVLRFQEDGQDVSVYESNAVLSYLEAAFPEPAIFGSTPLEKGKVAQVVSEVESYLAAPMMAFAQTFFFRNPEEHLDLLKEKAGNIRVELAKVEEQLGKEEYLVGNKISAADLILFPLCMILQRVASKADLSRFELEVPFESNALPNLASWGERIRAIPGFERTFPPHWKA